MDWQEERAIFAQACKETIPELQMPGDDMYPQYLLPPMRIVEQMYIDKNGTPAETIAFTIANKAETAIAMKEIDNAMHMAHEALNYDPKCLDAWRILITPMKDLIDQDSVLCVFREILPYARELYSDVFNLVGSFEKKVRARPYIRILTQMQYCGMGGKEFDTVTHCLEEIMRLAPNDYSKPEPRFWLLGTYLKLIGRKFRNDIAIPVRTVDHVKELLEARLMVGDKEIVLFEDDQQEVLIRWAKMMIAYVENKDWQRLADIEYRRCKWAFKLAFRKWEFVPPYDLDNPEHFKKGNDQDSTRRVEEIFKVIFEDWPFFIIELHKRFKGKKEKLFKTLNEEAPNIRDEHSREHQVKFSKVAEIFLEEGRGILADKDFMKAYMCFTQARRSFVEIATPSHRYYTVGAPFAISSNRATCAEFLGFWAVSKLDTRFTLLLKPNHIRSYERLPRIAKAFGVNQLYKIFSNMLSEIKSKSNISTGEWREYANKAIGLLSTRAIIYSKLGKLTDEYIEEFIRIGIDDAYTSVNVGPDIHPMLPWLTEEDIEEI